jgi:hypothetical protein
MDSFAYMTNPAQVGFKLCNLQYRNEVDTDNRYKRKVIYVDAVEVSGASHTRYLYDTGQIDWDEYIKLSRAWK